MTSPVTVQEDFRSMKGGDGEKIAMTSPVATDMSEDGSKCVSSHVLLFIVYIQAVPCMDTENTFKHDLCGRQSEQVSQTC